MHDEIAGRVWDAVGHWVEGQHEESVQILATLTEAQSPSMMYGVACGIATVAKTALTKMHGRQSHICFWGIKTLDGSRPEDSVPPHHLFAGPTTRTCGPRACMRSARRPGTLCSRPPRGATGEQCCCHVLSRRAASRRCRPGDPERPRVRRPLHHVHLPAGQPHEPGTRSCRERGPGRRGRRGAHRLPRDTRGQGPAICAGFAAHPRGRMASLALRLARASVLRIVPVTPDQGSGT